MDINQNNVYRKPNLSFFQKSYKNFKFIKKLTPDVIILNNFIEHIESLDDIKKLLAVINNSTILIIMTPDSSSKSKKFFGKYWSGYHSPRHVHIFNKKSISLFLKNNNLEYTIKNIFDPLSTLSSIKNCFTDFRADFTFKNFCKMLFYTIFFPIDFFNNKRILVLCKKK